MNLKNRLLTLFLFCSFGMLAQVVSQEISFQHHGCDFKGIISKPQSEGPFPAIVLIPGSGQNNRNGTLPLVGGNVQCLYPDLLGDTVKMYKDLAEGLSENGYLVLRYDELFISCPGYDKELSYSTLWYPAASALDYLKKRPDVAADKLILAGHSEGASLIPYLASQRNDVKALISIAGARTPLDSMMARQMTKLALQCNSDTALTNLQTRQILQYFTSMRNKNYNSSTPPFGGVKPAVWEKYIRVNDSVVEYYQLANLPSLFINFENDFNVPPSELQRFMTAVNGDHFDFQQIKGLTHYMTTLKNEAVSPVVARTINQWLSKQSFQKE